MEASNGMMKGDIVMLSTADWDNPFWTNKQHVAVTLASRGFRVLYIDSLGLRRPTASRRDLKRLIRRFGKGLRPPRRVQENIWIWSPILLPFHGSIFVQSLNRKLLSLGLFVWKRGLGMRSAWLWTYSPLTCALLSLEQWSKVIYHCVDEVKAQPGMPKQVLARAENTLVRRADVVFVTSTTLEKSRRVLNSNTHYFPNVADSRHFSTAMSEETVLPDDMAAIAGPRIGLIGALSGYKVDFELIREIALKRRDWSLVLIGEIGEGDPWTDSSLLRDVPNIHLLGCRPYSMLPSYLKGMHVAILPSRLNEYTEAMFPMKFFEYLASGRPVVSTMLPSLQAYGEIVCLAESPDSFMEGIENALRGRCAHLERRLELARQHTYEERTDRMLSIIHETVR
jgi:glycosyltransferase involved in cell wall biosynthesis